MIAFGVALAVIVIASAVLGALAADFHFRRSIR